MSSSVASAGFLGIRLALDPARLPAIAPAVPTAELTAHLEGLTRVAQGDPGAGGVAALDQSGRFGWLAAPSSTTVQPSGVHTGLCTDPEQTLDVLFDRLVA